MMSMAHLLPAVTNPHPVSQHPPCRASGSSSWCCIVSHIDAQFSPGHTCSWSPMTQQLPLPLSSQSPLHSSSSLCCPLWASVLLYSLSCCLSPLVLTSDSLPGWASSWSSTQCMVPGALPCPAGACEQQRQVGRTSRSLARCDSAGPGQHSVMEWKDMHVDMLCL